MVVVDRPTVIDPLEQLRLWIDRFLRFSADHPELLGLMNIEGRQDNDRLTYLHDREVGPSCGAASADRASRQHGAEIRTKPLLTYRT